MHFLGKTGGLTLIWSVPDLLCRANSHKANNMVQVFLAAVCTASCRLPGNYKGAKDAEVQSCTSYMFARLLPNLELP